MSLLQEMEKHGLAECEFNKTLILVSDLEHEINCLISNNAIKPSYPRLDELIQVRKNALSFIKGAV
jgi:hypothetical protein